MAMHELDSMARASSIERGFAVDGDQHQKETVFQQNHLDSQKAQNLKGLYTVHVRNQIR